MITHSVRRMRISARSQPRCGTMVRRPQSSKKPPREQRRSWHSGNTIVILPRWDRDTAARCVERYRVSSWTAVPTMIQDFYLNPNIDNYDLSSIRRLSGGGAAMPAAVAQRLEKLGISYVEGYGLTETMAATHINPMERPKPQCLGIPIFGVEARVVDPASLPRSLLSPGIRSPGVGRARRC